MNSMVATRSLLVNACLLMAMVDLCIGIEMLEWLSKWTTLDDPSWLFCTRI